MDEHASKSDFVKSKVISRLTRIVVNDGRSFIGKFETIDNAGNIFILDALEILDTKDENFFIHDLFKSAFHLQQNSDKFLKYVGSIIIPRVHITKVYVDNNLGMSVFKFSF